MRYFYILILILILISCNEKKAYSETRIAFGEWEYVKTVSEWGNLCMQG